MESLIIGLGHKMRHGKDTVAAELVERFGAVRYAFADELKVEVFNALCNAKDDFWQWWYVNEPTDSATEPLPVVPEYGPYGMTRGQKIAWIDQNKHSLRRVLQVYGTEYRRTQDPMYWVMRLSENVKRDRPAIAVIPDMRFRNEFYWVKSVGGVTVQVVRVGYPSTGGHASEIDLDGAPYDYLIAASDDNVDALRSGALTVFEKILKEREHEENANRYIPSRRDDLYVRGREANYGPDSNTNRRAEDPVSSGVRPEGGCEDSEPAGAD